MYLCQTLETASGQTFPMVGILPTTVQMGGGLHLGYRSTLALQDTPLMAKGTEAKGHEFHHSRLQQPLSPALLEIRAISQPHRPAQLDGWGSGNLHASYVHFHWGDRPEFTQRFVATCRQWLLSARLNR
jgi:cobyrinic acid a,c-diamide synthase